MTYMGRDGKQYVVIAAGGPARFRSIDATKARGSGHADCVRFTVAERALI